MRKTQTHMYSNLARGKPLSVSLPFAPLSVCPALSGGWGGETLKKKGGLRDAVF